MKLLTKYSRTNLYASVIILIFASVLYYFLLHFILVQQIDDDLNIEKKEISAYVLSYHTLPEIVPSEDEVTAYNLIKQKTNESLRTIDMTIGGETEMYRVIGFSEVANGNTYRIEVAKSLENTEKIIRLVILITIVMIIVLLLTSFVLNRIVLRKLWEPFHHTMKTIQAYRIGQKDLPKFEPTRIEEFQLLNNTLTESVARNESDYSTLKSFTENASHEMQTPVAVLRTKMDSLIQDESLTSSQSAIVQEAYTALQKLARINKSLLLLTKIENRQFDHKEVVDAEKIINEKISFFQEIVEKKNIHIQFSKTSDTLLTMNAGLADILFNNLLSNSIKYTKSSGEITIILSAGAIEFCNGPATLPLPEKIIFDRFYKSGEEPDQHGLGLAIVKEICHTSGLEIRYFFRKGEHVFKITIPEHEV